MRHRHTHPHPAGIVRLASLGDRSRQSAGQGQTHSGLRAHRGLACRGTAPHTDGPEIQGHRCIGSLFHHWCRCRQPGRAETHRHLEPGSGCSEGHSTRAHTHSGTRLVHRGRLHDYRACGHRDGSQVGRVEAGSQVDRGSGSHFPHPHRSQPLHMGWMHIH